MIYFTSSSENNYSSSACFTSRSLPYPTCTHIPPSKYQNRKDKQILCHIQTENRQARQLAGQIILLIWPSLPTCVFKTFPEFRHNKGSILSEFDWNWQADRNVIREELTKPQDINQTCLRNSQTHKLPIFCFWVCTTALAWVATYPLSPGFVDKVEQKSTQKLTDCSNTALSSYPSMVV